MKIALNNPHLNRLISYHDYVKYLLIHEEVSVLYFSDHSGVSFLRGFKNYLRNNSLLKFLRLDDYEIVFTPRTLSNRADALLDINLMTGSLEYELPVSLKSYDGLKIAHIGDYFWYHKASYKNKILEYAGIDHLLGYSMHDRHCRFFYEKFPKYRNKTWGIPFGFGGRFTNNKIFGDRENKTVAIGSVNPLSPALADSINYIESVNFFQNENWFHRFRHDLSKNKQSLLKVMDSMLPESPLIKNTKFDLPTKFNEYKMFVCCDSIYNFPSAKVYEGMACGSVLVSSNHNCNKDIGLVDGDNCIMFEYENIGDFAVKVNHFQKNPELLEKIAQRGENFVNENYTHLKVSTIIVNTIKKIILKPDANAIPVRELI